MRAFHYIDWNQLQKEWDEIMKDIKKDLEELDEMSNKEIIKKFL